MKLSKLENKGTLCALVNCENTVITDTQSALDLLMNAKYDIGTKNIVFPNSLLQRISLSSVRDWLERYYKSLSITVVVLLFTVTIHTIQANR